jgi:ADP-heptose:LPS heptosyltransferase
MKEDAILTFHVGEFGWELLRFCPHVLWNYRIKYKRKVKLIVCSRQERYDLYGKDVDVFHPFTLDEPGMKQDCFKLTGFRDQDYYDYLNTIVQLYSKKYNIIDKIYPSIENRKYTQRTQLPMNQMDYNFNVRESNKDIYKFMYKNDKPSIVIAPRYREGVKRNWPHWKEFYDLIEPYKKYFNFIICGKEPDVILDDRYYKATYANPDWDHEEEWSLVGVIIEIIKNSVLTIGSQSGIPNLSNLLGTPTLQWGHERHEHSKTYNVKNTETIYIDDPLYNIDPHKIIKEMTKFLKGKGLV